MRRHNSRHAQRPCDRPAPRGFTVVELLVVIGIIVLVLALGLPAFNSMAIQQRAAKARQLLNGTLTRTYITAVSNKDLAAVRIFPAAWDMDSKSAGANGGAATSGRQMIAAYEWKQTPTADPANPLLVRIEERFERMVGGPSFRLPPDTWVAPIEAFADDPNRDAVCHHDMTGGTDTLGDFTLDGEIGRFELDAAGRHENFFDADDFLIVFDPEQGVLRSARGMRRNVWPLYAFDPRPVGEAPTAQTETSGQRGGNGEILRDFAFQRHNYTGAVVYQREPFEALGKTTDAATIEARRNTLRRLGQAYYVDRHGGNLVAAGSLENQGG